MKNALCAFLIVLGIAPIAIAHRGDSDPQFCYDVRQEALDVCKDASDRRQCYRSTVDEILRKYNEETRDLSGGGEETCVY